MAVTPSIGLHQWQPNDAFLRSDFNTDFQKIDTAIDTLSKRVLIREVVTTAASQQIDLSLSDIDFTQYSRLEIHLQGTTQNDYRSIIRINGIESNYTNSIDYTITTYLTYFGIGTQTHPNARRTLLTLHLDTDFPSCYCEIRGDSGTPPALSGLKAASNLPTSQMHTLNFILSDQQTFYPGTKFTIVGVRK